MADRQEATIIESLTNKFVEAFRAGDFHALANMYTNDAVICPPRSKIIIGKSNIESFWQQNHLIEDLRFDSMSVKPLGERAMRVVGTLGLRLKGPPGLSDVRGAASGIFDVGVEPSPDVSAKYISVWEKVGDDWKIESFIWNGMGARRGSRPLPAAVRRLPQNDLGSGMRSGGGPRAGGRTGPAGGPRAAGMDYGGPDDGPVGTGGWGGRG